MNPQPAPTPAALANSDTPTTLTQLALLFLKLGIIGFGGPAAHIALLEDEVVRKRRWLDHQEFLDLLGAANLIPGPTSTEMTMHIGHRRCGMPGLIMAGVCYIAPAALISAAFAWFYVAYGKIPSVQHAFTGIQGVVLAIIAQAAWKLGKPAAKTAGLILLGIAVGAAAALGVSEIIALLAGGLAGLLLFGMRNHKKPPAATLLALAASAWPALAKAATPPLAKISALTTGTAIGASAAAAPAAGGITAIKLGLFFFSIGSVMYGSGYVLIAFLEGWLVDQTGLLTKQQLIDAVAVGQFTPGPVSSTATFIGYTLAGGAGAVTATVGMFLPSFIFVSLLSPLLPKLRKSVRAASFLDAVNIGSVALIAVVTIRLAMDTASNWVTAATGITAFAFLLTGKIGAATLIVAGAVVGLIAGLI